MFVRSARSVTNVLRKVSQRDVQVIAKRTITTAATKRVNVASHTSLNSSILSSNSTSQTTLQSIKFNKTPISVRGFATEAIKTVVVPSMGDSISSGTIKQLNKKVGEFAEKDEVIVAIETDKIVVEIRAPEAGQITEFFTAADQDVLVGAKLFALDTSKTAGPKAAAPAETPKAAPAASTPTPAPAASKPAEAPKASTPAPTPTPAPSQSKPSAPVSAPTVKSGSPASGEHRQRMSKMRQKIAERLKDSQNTYAMLTTFNEVDMSNAMTLRNEFGQEFVDKHGVKLGFMSIFVRAATIALQQQPIVNAVIDLPDVIYRDNIDISVAVATPTGLVVPVLRGTDTMGFADIEKEIANLGKKARDNALTLEDMTGGTFTISNGGVYGSMMGTPIINPPQSAILGMHGITNRAVVVGKEIQIRPMMYLALTYDHRLIDGKDAVTFLKKIRDLVQDPRRMLLDI